VIPDPGLPVTGQHSDAEEVMLPDDSLADADLHDHDLIDSVMYIYFGSSTRTDGATGRQVLLTQQVFDTFPKLQKITITFIMSISGCLSVPPH
jgi:hypothetical protein